MVQRGMYGKRGKKEDIMSRFNVGEDKERGKCATTDLLPSGLYRHLDLLKEVPGKGTVKMLVG